MSIAKITEEHGGTVDTSKIAQNDQQHRSGTVSCSQASSYEVYMFSLVS